jgi:hypothetical protein
MSSTNLTDAAALAAAMSASGTVPSAAAIRAAMMAAAARGRSGGGRSAGERKPDTNVNSEEDRENAEEREEHNHEDLISYEAYRPAKLGYGVKHPDPVVENSSLAAIPPPDITCTWQNGLFVTMIMSRCLWTPGSGMMPFVLYYLSLLTKRAHLLYDISPPPTNQKLQTILQCLLTSLPRES